MAVEGPRVFRTGLRLSIHAASHNSSNPVCTSLGGRGRQTERVPPARRRASRRSTFVRTADRGLTPKQSLDGRDLFGMPVALANLRSQFTTARTNDALAEARACGHVGGLPRKFDRARSTHTHVPHTDGVPIRAIARDFNVDPASIPAGPAQATRRRNPGRRQGELGQPAKTTAVQATSRCSEIHDSLHPVAIARLIHARDFGHSHVGSAVVIASGGRLLAPPFVGRTDEPPPFAPRAQRAVRGRPAPSPPHHRAAPRRSRLSTGRGGRESRRCPRMPRGRR
ncbi:hypothetical protein ABIA38_003449 [Embleya sp. AB8]